MYKLVRKINFIPSVTEIRNIDWITTQFVVQAWPVVSIHAEKTDICVRKSLPLADKLMLKETIVVSINHRRTATMEN